MSQNLSIQDAFNDFDLMSPTEKKISLAFSSYFTKSIKENTKNSIFPSQETLAKKANCSVESVKKFISSYPLLVKAHQRRASDSDNFLDFQTRNGRFQSNVYELDPVFFFVVAYLKYKKLVNIWKAVRKKIITQILNFHDDAAVICDLKVWVMNFKDNPDDKGKNANISNISSSKQDMVPTNPSDCGAKHSLQERFFGEIRRNLDRLSSKGVEFALRFASPAVLWEVKKDIEFAIKNEVKIKYHDNWLISRIKCHLNYLTSVLNRKCHA